MVCCSTKTAVIVIVFGNNQEFGFFLPCFAKKTESGSKSKKKAIWKGNIFMMIIFWERKKSPTPFHCHFNLQLNSLSNFLSLSLFLSLLPSPLSFRFCEWKFLHFLTSHCRRNFLLKVHPILNYLSQTSVFELCFPLPSLGWYFADDCRPLENFSVKRKKKRKKEEERGKKEEEGKKNRENEKERGKRQWVWMTKSMLGKSSVGFIIFGILFFWKQKKRKSWEIVTLKNMIS